MNTIKYGDDRVNLDLRIVRESPEAPLQFLIRGNVQGTDERQWNWDLAWRFEMSNTGLDKPEKSKLQIFPTWTRGHGGTFFIGKDDKEVISLVLADKAGTVKVASLGKEEKFSFGHNHRNPRWPFIKTFLIGPRFCSLKGKDQKVSKDLSVQIADAELKQAQLNKRLAELRAKKRQDNRRKR